MQLIHPDWPAPITVRSAMTTRLGGISEAPYDALNLGYATQDKRASVAHNETLVTTALGVASRNVRWVYQVHGVTVHHAEQLPENQPLGGTTIQGDAIVSRTAGLVCGIKVADCMPILLTSRAGDVVAAVHAGWRGLLAGVIENTISVMGVAPDQLLVWLGPCIGATAFEVGEEVLTQFASRDANAVGHFRALPQAGKFLCDLHGLARQRLAGCGVTAMYGSSHCTFHEPELFFSHRRDGATGRMAAFVWIESSR